MRYTRVTALPYIGMRHYGFLVMLGRKVWTIDVRKCKVTRHF